MPKILLICSLLLSCGDACREIKKIETGTFEDPLPKCRIFYYMTPTHLKDVAEEKCDIPRPDYIKVYTVINGEATKHVGRDWDVDIALAQPGLDKTGVNILYLFSTNAIW